MINIYELKLTNLQQRILRLLFVKMGIGIKLNALGLARNLSVSQPAISKSLPLMIKENLIKVEKDKDSGRLSIEANRDNPKILQLKRVDNLKLIYESGLADYLEKEFAGGTIILFGSYSRGDDIFNSDIDIVIIGRKDKLVNLGKFEEVLEKEIRINFYNSFKDIHKNLKNNILNGIIISGGVEL